MLDKNIRKLKGSATFAINERCKELRKCGMKIHNLGLGQSPFPVHEDIVDELKKYANKNRYLPSAGDPDLRQAISNFYKHKYDLSFDSDQIFVGMGLKDLLFMFQLVFDSSKVKTILPTPGWATYLPQIEAFGNQYYAVHTKFENDWKITAEELDSAARFIKGADTLYLILNSPGNPNGQSYTTEELKSLAEVCRSYNMIVMYDEVYSLLDFNKAHDSLARYYPEGTISGNGLSKWAAAGGWRLGTLAFPKELKDLRRAMINVASESFSNIVSPVSFAATTAFNGDYEAGYLEHTRKILQVVGQNCYQKLHDAGVMVASPKGGFYLFVDFEKFRDKFKARGIKTGREACKRLLNETGVAILPGSDFVRPEYELSGRIAYIDFDGAAALEAARSGESVDNAFALKHAPSVSEAADKIVDWVKNL
jgi:aspartate aminotransferase